MIMVARLPQETYQTILRYAISVPIFFEVVPSQDIETMITLYHNPDPYYASERTRNTFRRVCYAWNEYIMSKYSFRYVDFDDISAGHIPAYAGL